MLVVTIPENETYDERTGTFFHHKSITLQLEHSLLSLSKWESKWCKPFMSKEKKTVEEVLDYVRCMTINSGVDTEIYKTIPDDILKQIVDYIEAPMTATTIHNQKEKAPSREIITSELIYYWMIASNIPFECQKWHLNRLLTLINVCSIKNSPPKKMSKSDIINRNRSLNAARKAKLGTHG